MKTHSHSFIIRLILLLTVGLPLSGLASQVVWFSRAAAVHQSNTGTPLDSSYTFELGAFEPGFIPLISNTAQWAAKWTPTDRSAYVPGTQTFGGTRTLSENTPPFLTSNRGYIWGYSTDAPTSWILIGDPSWKWPDASELIAFPQQWSVSAAATVIAGQVDPNEASGFFLKMGTVNNGTLPMTTSAAWLTSHFNATQLADTSISDWQADPDGDGINNLLELALGANPMVPDHLDLPVPTLVTHNGKAYLQMSFAKSPSAPLSYAVEVTFDQVNWNGGPQFVNTLVDTPTRLVVRSTFPVEVLDQQFMRLVLTLEP